MTPHRLVRPDSVEHPLDELIGAEHPDLEHAMRGGPLADLECGHGRLPGDLGRTCECWEAPHVS
jgi:hypothetical protein